VTLYNPTGGVSDIALDTLQIARLIAKKVSASFDIYSILQPTMVLSDTNIKLILCDQSDASRKPGHSTTLIEEYV
jgi:hypothetical protein